MPKYEVKHARLYKRVIYYFTCENCEYDQDIEIDSDQDPMDYFGTIEDRIMDKCMGCGVNVSFRNPFYKGR